ncbi:hypothetical protein VTO73DRAFT_2982 [Trametes versicolor]
MKTNVVPASLASPIASLRAPVTPERPPSGCLFQTLMGPDTAHPAGRLLLRCHSAQGISLPGLHAPSISCARIWRRASRRAVSPRIYVLAQAARPRGPGAAAGGRGREERPTYLFDIDSET